MLRDVNGVEGFQAGLSVGENVIKVRVLAQDGVTTETYTITVTRAERDLSLSAPEGGARPSESASARYDVTFEGAWTEDVTPGGVPYNAWFSGLIGAVHDAGASFLADGEVAGPGVEALAETGATSALRAEFTSAGRRTLAVHQANRSPIGPEEAETLSGIVVGDGRPRVTFVAGIAPSHDWFVGVSGLSLLDSQGRWLPSHTVDLYPWDAGTEDGTDFYSLPDIDTRPRGVVHSIRGEGRFSTEPIATLTFTRRELGPFFPPGESGARVVAENLPAGQDVGAPVVALDPDPGDTLTYSLEGPDAGAFTIDGSSGQLRTRVVLDHEARPAHSVTVVASDPSGLSARITVTIAVTNVEEPGAVSLWPVQPRVDTVLRATLSDPDGDLQSVIWEWERSTDQSDWTGLPTVGASYTPTSDDPGCIHPCASLLRRRRRLRQEGRGRGGAHGRRPGTLSQYHAGHARPGPRYPLGYRLRPGRHDAVH